MKPLQEFQTGEYSGKLYSRIVKELGEGRSIGSGPIYYDCLIKEVR